WLRCTCHVSPLFHFPFLFSSSSCPFVSSWLRVSSSSLPREDRPLLGDQRQERLLRIGKLRRPFLHQRLLELLLIHLRIDLIQHCFRRQRMHLPRIGLVQLLHRIIGRRRIGLYIAPRQGLDILIR